MLERKTILSWCISGKVSYIKEKILKEKGLFIRDIQQGDLDSKKGADRQTVCALFLFRHYCIKYAAVRGDSTRMLSAESRKRRFCN